MISGDYWLKLQTVVDTTRWLEQAQAKTDIIQKLFVGLKIQPKKREIYYNLCIYMNNNNINGLRNRLRQMPSFLRDHNNNISNFKCVVKYPLLNPKSKKPSSQIIEEFNEEKNSKQTRRARFAKKENLAA